MRNSSLVLFLFLCLTTGQAQLILSGTIEPSTSGKWDNKLYVLRIDRLGLQSPNVVDSIPLANDGSFTYKFMDDPQGILFELRQPLKGQGVNYTISGFEDHWFLISTEEKGEVKLHGHADSLYYSLAITQGAINKKLLLFRDIKRPASQIARAAIDSIHSYPVKKEYYRGKYMKITMEEAGKARQKIISILDTCKNTTLTLAGIINLNEASLGSLSGEQIKKYSSHLPDNARILLVKNTKKAITEVDRNRVGIVLPEVPLTDYQGKRTDIMTLASQFKVLDFWASWCGPCRYANKNQLPELNSFLSANGIPLIGVTIDEDEKKWKQAVKVDNTTWHQVIDSSYALSKILDIQGVPSYLVLGENNEVVYEAGSSILVKLFLEGKLSK